MCEQQNYANIQKPKTGVWKILSRILFVISLLMNIFIVLLIILAISFAGVHAIDGYQEATLVKGMPHQKIAVVNLEGVITAETEMLVTEQIQFAQADDNVKAVILKINSPGGGVSASDNIHHAISKFREDTNKPVICFMDGLAASGGYYSAVACDGIIASPTTITGSIGVIMGHMNISQLLQEKLGVEPTTIKSGEKKDWPSIFREITADEKQYLMNKVINPAYERFVMLVDEGRENLSKDKVYNLADGSIYYAQEAANMGLVDGVGYFEKAMSVAAEKANLTEPTVVEYHRQFSIADFMQSSAKAVNVLDKNALIEYATPQIMYLWTGKN